MSSRKLILVKHSLPEIIPGTPPNQWRLSDLGRARCKLLADQLGVFEPGMIISSVEPKAVETAEIVGQELNKTIEMAQGLQEHERADARLLDDEGFTGRVAELFSNPNQLVFGKETADQAYKRVNDAMSRVLECYPQGNVAVISHGTVITLYVSRLIGLEPFPLWKRLGLPSFVVLNLPEFELAKVVENVE